MYRFSRVNFNISIILIKRNSFNQTFDTISFHPAILRIIIDLHRSENFLGTIDLKYLVCLKGEGLWAVVHSYRKRLGFKRLSSYLRQNFHRYWLYRFSVVDQNLSWLFIQFYDAINLIGKLLKFYLAFWGRGYELRIKLRNGLIYLEAVCRLESRYLNKFLAIVNFEGHKWRIKYLCSNFNIYLNFSRWDFSICLNYYVTAFKIHRQTSWKFIFIFHSNRNSTAVVRCLLDNADSLDRFPNLNHLTLGKVDFFLTIENLDHQWGWLNDLDSCQHGKLDFRILYLVFCIYLQYCTLRVRLDSFGQFWKLIFKNFALRLRY